MRLISEITTVFTFLIFSFNSFSTNKTDSLLNVLHHTQSDSMRTIVLADLSFDLCYSYPDSALNFGIESLMLAQKNKNVSGVALAYNRIGIVFDITNKWDSALVCYNYAVQYAQVANDSTTLASAYNNIGLIYWNKTEYDLALDYYFKSLEVFRLIKREKGVASTLNNISLIYWEQGEILRAIDYQFQALKIRENLRDDYGMSASYVNLGMLYDDLDSFNLSINFYKKGIELKKDIHDDYGLAIAYTDLGITYEHLKQNDSAEYYVMRGAKLHESNHSFGLSASSYLSLSSIYVSSNKFNQAEEVLLKAESLANNSQSLRVLCLVYKAQADLYLKLGRYKLSASYYKKFVPLQDSLFNLEKVDRFKTIEQKFQTEKKDKEIAELKNEKLNNELIITQNQIDLLNAKNVIFTVSFVLVLFALIGLILFYRVRIKNQQERNELIIAANKKMVKEIFKATEIERQRIGKDLHDGIGQQLSGIKLALSSIASNENFEEKIKLERVTAILDESANDLRVISHQMMPKTLNELGLTSALTEMFEKSFNLSNIKWRFEHFNINERFNSDIEIAIYRIAQELTNNIIKHSGAKSVEAQLYLIRNDLVFILIDDGIGLDESKIETGHGFNNINARVQSLNGKITVAKNLPSGVEVTLSVKVK